MSSVICTLFEGHYHFGVAALANSLYRQGYRGEIYAGYRGELPDWASIAVINTNLNWTGARSLHATEGLVVHFLPLTTKFHLTNYKPDFMLELWNGAARQAEAMFYFDPDMVVSASWENFLNWINGGVGLCEDVNSPLSRHHPRRLAWRSFFGSRGFNLKFKDTVYVNGGFIGLTIKNISFLKVWKQLQEEMASEIGGLNRSALTGLALPKKAQGPFAPFSKTDQDALNATIEEWDGVVSLVGKEAMAFKSGAALMPHALGQHKPWNSNYIARCFNGFTPRLVDKLYWSSIGEPIHTHNPLSVRLKKLAIGLSIFVSRFYRRIN